MKRLAPFFTLFAFAATLTVIFFERRASADDAVTSKMLALFAKFDDAHQDTLSADDQARAVEFVKSTFGDQWARQIQKMFTRAAGPDRAISLEAWRKEVAAFSHPPAVQTVRIPMRDGVKLATDIYLPHGDGPFPVILARTPYSRVKQNEGAPNFAAAGYAFVNQDMRGRFDSEGENLPFAGCGWSEHEDGVDTIEWIKKQAWCNGHVGTIGVSAGGITQNLLAGAVPDGLTAQYISVAAASLYSDASYIGGAFRKADTENWLTGNQFDPHALDLIRSHPSYDDYWKRFDTTAKFAVMNVPAVHIGGWFDMFCQGTIDEFMGRQHHGATGSRGTQKLIMGPWTHAIGRTPAGEFTFPHVSVPDQYNASRWFDHYLGGTQNGVEQEPAVAYYVMGDTQTPGAPGNEWRYASDWPIPARDTSVYFLPNGQLGFDKPAATEAHLDYTFDPESPCPTVGGNNLTLPRGPMNQNKIENRHDGVIFTSAPLDAPIEVTGRVQAHIFVAASTADTDLSVRLCDVYPDGKSYLIAEGMLRLRYRNSKEKPEPLTPGRIEEVLVDCWSTSIIFNTGHRARVTITSSNFPRFDVNPGTGEAWSDSGSKLRQTNRIYCDSAHPSALIVPVVPARTAP
jgi:predicted acyl esterase